MSFDWKCRPLLGRTHHVTSPTKSRINCPVGTKICTVDLDFTEFEMGKKTVQFKLLLLDRVALSSIARQNVCGVS